MPAPETVALPWSARPSLAGGLLSVWSPGASDAPQMFLEYMPRFLTSEIGSTKINFAKLDLINYNIVKEY